MKKRIQFQQVLALICAISMLLPICSALGLQFNLSAAEKTAQNLNYYINYGSISCKITGLEDRAATEVTIPR